jgi:sugar phosphate isomerase/epimerase
VNRIALHQSTVHPLDPVALVDVAQRAGLDSVGLRVAAAADVERWWSRGIGSPMLRELVDALLARRVTVLDVGRVPLGPELCVVDVGHPYGRVLELGSRLGAQYVTVRAGAPADDPAEFFARLAELAGRYHLRPLLSLAAGTAVTTLEQAVATVDGTDGGVVLDVVPGRDTALEVDQTVVELGERLGYVRVSARALAHTAAPGLLATLPPQVPVAIGGAPGGGGTPADQQDPVTDPAAQVNRVAALRAAVDAMLRHPHAAPSAPTRALWINAAAEQGGDPQVDD